ncbi:hypothetical protein FF1_025697 [Malus domestica]
MVRNDGAREMWWWVRSTVSAMCTVTIATPVSIKRSHKMHNHRDHRLDHFIFFSPKHGYKAAFDYVATEKAIAMLLRSLAHHGVPRRHLCSGLPTRRRIPRSPDVYEEFAVNKVYCWSVVANGEDNSGVCLETEKMPSFPETESKVDEESKNAVVLLPSVESRETVT